MNAVSSSLNSMMASFRKGVTRANPTILATLALFALIWGAALSYDSESRRQNEEDFSYQVVGIARGFEHDVTEMVTRYDHLTRHISALSSTGPLDFESVVQALYDVTNRDAYVSITDSSGNIIASSSPSFPRIRVNMSDRASFLNQKDSATDQLFISPPVAGRLTGNQVIHLTRPLRKPSGEFNGVVLVSVPVTALTKRYQKISLGRGGGLALVGTDGIFRAGSGGFTQRVGQHYREPLVVGTIPVAHALIADTKDFVERQIFDGASRMVVSRSIAGYPLRVMAAMTQDAGTGTLSKTSYSFLIAVALLSIAELLAGLVIFRSQKQATNYARQRSSLELEKRLAEANATDRGLFLAVMSHEIRTPLNGVLGALDLMRDCKLDSRGKRCVKMATENGESLLRLIDDILLFSKSENSQIDLLRERFSIKDLGESVHEALLSLTVIKGNTFTISISEEAGHFVTGDPRRLRQVLINLINNANKFTDRGKVVLKVDSLPSPENKLVARFSVIDTGIGIPKDKQALIFNRFETLDASYTRRTDGAGLGLAICDKIVRAMGTEITVESEPGRGSTFSFVIEFNFAEPEVPAVVSGIVVEPQNDKAGKCSLRILLAEDNPTNTYVATEMLTDAGHEVRHACNRREAVAASLEEHFDLILMDVSMPEMSGVEAASAIRCSGTASATVPIIALTAHAVPGDEQRFMNAGMTAYLTKPVRREILLETLSEIQQRLPKAVEAVATISRVAQSVESAPQNRMEAKAFLGFVEARPVERVLKTINIFVTELNQKAIDLTGIIDRKEIIALKDLAHSTVGSGSMLGAGKLVNQARDLERRCLTGAEINWSDVLDFHTEMRETIGDFSFIKCEASLKEKIGDLKTAA